MSGMFGNIRKLPADKISGRMLAVLIALSAVLFAAFFLIGYNMPFVDDPSFNAPLLTDVILIYSYLLIVATIVVLIISVVRSFRRRSSSEVVINGVPAARISYLTLALLVVSLGLTFAFGSVEPVKVNGVNFTETFWLRAADMFIITSEILTAVAVMAVIFGVSGLNRRVKLRRK